MVRDLFFLIIRFALFWCWCDVMNFLVDVEYFTSHNDIHWKKKFLNSINDQKLCDIMIWNYIIIKSVWNSVVLFNHNIDVRVHQWWCLGTSKLMFGYIKIDVRVHQNWCLCSWFSFECSTRFFETQAFATTCKYWGNFLFSSWIIFRSSTWRCL